VSSNASSSLRSRSFRAFRSRAMCRYIGRALPIARRRGTPRCPRLPVQSWLLPGSRHREDDEHRRSTLKRSGKRRVFQQGVCLIGGSTNLAIHAPDHQTDKPPFMTSPASRRIPISTLRQARP
jgi:hypothetical protein